MFRSAIKFSMQKIKLLLAGVLIAAALPSVSAENASSRDSYALGMALRMFSPAQLLVCYQDRSPLHSDIEEIWNVEPKSLIPAGPDRDFLLACAAKIELMSAQQCRQLINFFQSMKNKKGEVSTMEVQAYFQLTEKFIEALKAAELKEESCARPK